jgi:NAD(P)H-dependent FMN reductase
MKLIIFNGSPRKAKSSTKILLDQFLDGFNSLEGNEYEMFFLRSVKDREQHITSFTEAEYVIIGFPLYTDSMPSFVKEFFELLDPFCSKLETLSVGYLVQSGFPEANQSRYVERYLEKFTRRMGCKYLGTIIKGNANRIDERPKFMVKPVLKNLYNLGKIFGHNGKFDRAILSKLAKPEKLTGFALFLTRLLIKTRMATKFWDDQLKVNGVFEKRFNTPFLKP